MSWSLKVNLESPLHLGSGKGDVVIDAEIVHDRYGLPYFPAKRLKGLLFESALEVAEMLEVSGRKIFSSDDVKKVFGKDNAQAELFFHDLHLQDYENLQKQWAYLQKEFKNILSYRDVLEAYTSLRYQTSIDENGVTEDGSLHNMRALDSGLTFVGEIKFEGGDLYLAEKILVCAAANLRYAGAKRNRGFGKISCELIGAGSVDDVLGGNR